jgi:hypothetical protein
MNTGTVTRARQIANRPFYIQTLDSAVHAFLSTLPAPDFSSAAATQTLWAVQATARAEGSAAGTAYVVSQECYKRIKAHRF